MTIKFTPDNFIDKLLRSFGIKKGVNKNAAKTASEMENISPYISSDIPKESLLSVLIRLIKEGMKKHHIRLIVLMSVFILGCLLITTSIKLGLAICGTCFILLFITTKDKKILSFLPFTMVIGVILTILFQWFK
jgi:hypothetical protein